MTERLMSMNEVTLEYVNQLRYNLDAAQNEVDALKKPASQGQPMEAKAMSPSEAGQMAAVRHKSTQLEEENRNLRRLLQTYQGWQGEKQALEGLIVDYRKIERQHLAELEKLRRMHVESPLQESIEIFATEAMRWCVDTFGGRIANDPKERACRLVEEAVEVAQSVGVDSLMIWDIMTMVYRKTPGDPPQELGGTIICWMVMARALGHNPSWLIRTALKDCWARQDAIREKLKAKIAAGASPSTFPDQKA